MKFPSKNQNDTCSIRFVLVAFLLAVICSQALAREFLIGWYTNNYVPIIDEVSGHGEDLILPCRTWNDASNTQNWAFLNEAKNRDMKVIIDLNRNALLAGNATDATAKIVNYVKDKHGLMGYHLFDEPEFHKKKMPVSYLEKIYKEIKILDPDHPVLMSFGVANGISVESVRPYKNAMDGFVIDRYPVGKKCPEFYGALWQVSKATMSAVDLAKAEKLSPFYVAIQAFADRKTNRLPTYGELRYMTYAPLVHGADGLLYWWTGGWGKDPEGCDPSYRRKIVNPIVQELDSLTPAFVSGVTNIRVSSNRDIDTKKHGIHDVSYLLGEMDDAYILIAMCNTSGRNVTFKLIGQGLRKVGRKVQVLNESRTVSLKGKGSRRTLSDKFGTYDVNIYRIAKQNKNKKI